MKEYIVPIYDDGQDDDVIIIGYIREDATEIVRCKDCKWWVAHPKWQTENGYCKYILVLFYVAKKADDYCSCGERRNGERVYLQSR